MPFLVLLVRHWIRLIADATLSQSSTHSPSDCSRDPEKETLPSHHTSFLDACMDSQQQHRTIIACSNALHGETDVQDAWAIVDPALPLLRVLQQ